MDAKLLTESGWKTVAAKSKVKDNGLQRALAVYEKLPDDKFAERLKAIGSVNLLAGNLKKSKDVAAIPAVIDYLADLVRAADSEEGAIIKGKALAEKSAKAEALAQKNADAQTE